MHVTRRTGFHQSRLTGKTSAIRLSERLASLCNHMCPIVDTPETPPTITALWYQGLNGVSLIGPQFEFELKKSFDVSFSESGVAGFDIELHSSLRFYSNELRRFSEIYRHITVEEEICMPRSGLRAEKTLFPFPFTLNGI